MAVPSWSGHQQAPGSMKVLTKSTAGIVAIRHKLGNVSFQSRRQHSVTGMRRPLTIYVFSWKTLCNLR
jgi:hypothetical protein